jgi:hypothetical protein
VPAFPRNKILPEKGLTRSGNKLFFNWAWTFTSRHCSLSSIQRPQSTPSNSAENCVRLDSRCLGQDSNPARLQSQHGELPLRQRVGLDLLRHWDSKRRPPQLSALNTWGSVFSWSQADILPADKMEYRTCMTHLTHFSGSKFLSDIYPQSQLRILLMLSYVLVSQHVSAPTGHHQVNTIIFALGECILLRVWRQNRYKKTFFRNYERCLCVLCYFLFFFLFSKLLFCFCIVNDLIIYIMSQILLLQNLNIHIFSIIGVQLILMLGRGCGFHLLRT